MNNKNPQTFSDDEMSAMRERSSELKANKAEGRSQALAKIAEMSEPDKSMALKIHQLITQNIPNLTVKTWYGMPAYALGDKVVCFFQSAAKFKSRYATLGFSDLAKLDEGAMWPASYALKALTKNEEKLIVELIKKAVG